MHLIYWYPTETGFPDSGYLRKGGPDHLLRIILKFSATFTAHMHVFKKSFLITEKLQQIIKLA